MMILIKNYMLVDLKIALNFLCDSREAKFLGMNSANLNRTIFNFSSLTFGHMQNIQKCFILGTSLFIQM